MKIVNIPASKLEVGMILAYDIKIAGGMMVLKKGTELTESYIKKMQKENTMGIHVEVSDFAPLHPDELHKIQTDPKYRRELRFKGCADDIYMSELIKVVKEMKEREGSDG